MQLHRYWFFFIKCSFKQIVKMKFKTIIIVFLLNKIITCQHMDVTSVK